MLCCCKLESLALILVISASHHFILLHSQGPSPSPAYGPPDSPPDYAPPAPLPESPPPPSPDSPTPSSPESSPAPPPESSPAPPPPPSPESPPPPSPESPPPPPPDSPTPSSPESSPAPPPGSLPAQPPPSSPTWSSALPPDSPPAQPPQPIIEAHNRTTPTGLIAGAVIGSVLIVAGLCTCFFIWRKRRSRPSPQPQPQPPKVTAKQEVALSLYAPPSPSIVLRLGPRSFTYEELDSATNGFSDSNFLGEGGYGVVHKGVVPYEETCVAIKQLKSGIQQAQREFLTEIQVIHHVHHKNLVSLIGYCIDEAHGKMMLVYEYVPNKTLGFHLHERGTETINWKTRMKIAIGSAKGLAYLHEECQPKIIHRDIKATNILIDNNFEPKVADFGLARFSLETQVITRIMGSFGYLAPEYAASGKLTDKSDVFSFGVVLLELITGRKPVGDTEAFPNGSMVEWARRLFSEALEKRNFEGIADERLENDYEIEEMFRMVSCAANCIRHSATNRPRMSQVIQALEGVICLDNDLTTDENPARSHLSKGLSKLRKIAFRSYSTTHSDQLRYYSTTSTTTSTSSSGSKIFI